MNFRLADSEEVQQLAYMRWDFWLEDGQDPPQSSRADFVECFSDWLLNRNGRNWFVWCALDNDTIVSHIYVQRVEKLPKPSATDDAFGYVTNVYTRPEYRSQGIGAELLGCVKTWALQNNLEFLVLWPSAESIPFWHRAEFSENESLLSKIRPYVN